MDHADKVVKSTLIGYGTMILMRRVAAADLRSVGWYHVLWGARTPLRLVLAIAVVVALVSVQQWLSGYPEGVGVALVLLLLGGGLLLAVLPSGTTTAEKSPLVAASLARDRTWVALGSAAVGVLCAVASGALVISHIWLAQRLWLAAVACPFLGLLIVSQPWRIERPFITRVGGRVALGDVVLLLIPSLAMRLPHLLTSPPFVVGDEAACGLFGRLFNAGATPLLSFSWYGLPMLSYAISGVGMRLFGDDLYGLRMINVVIGSGCVVLLYLLGRELFGRWPALLAALVLSVSFLHVELSRDGIHYMQGVTALTLTFYLTLRWLRHGGALMAFLAGASMILDLQVYWSARAAPLLVLALVGLLVLMDRPLLAARWRGVPWLLVGVLTAGIPLFALNAAYPGNLTGHDTQVNIFLNRDISMSQHLLSVYKSSDPWAILPQQFWRTITTFNSRGDSSGQIHFGGAMLDTVSAALLPAALLLVIARARRWSHLFLIVWFMAIVAAGTITVDPPWWPRLAAITPCLALMLGLLLARIGEFCRQGYHPLMRGVAGGLIVALLTTIAVGNARLVFTDFPAGGLHEGAMNPTAVGTFLATAPGAADTVLLSDNSFDLLYYPVPLLAPRSGGCTSMALAAPCVDPQAPATAGCTQEGRKKTSDCIDFQRSTLFVLLGRRESDLPWLEQQRPGGHTVVVQRDPLPILAYELPTAPGTTH